MLQLDQCTQWREVKNKEIQFGEMLILVLACRSDIR